MKTRNIIILSAFVSSLLLSASALAMLNPAMVYCQAINYSYSETAEGGTCGLPDSTTVDAWAFLKGKVAQEFSYCTLNGYGIRTVNDPDVCARFLSDDCAVCILPNATEVEVTELMGLSFEETTCGDGSCGIPENYASCPGDCQSGSWDGYCDGAADGRCDTDCVSQRISNQDVDCPMPDVCGDGICKGETYTNCSRDCPSGMADGYCDKVKDQKCDPDCRPDLDGDCVKPFNMIWVYVIVAVVVGVLIFLIVVRSWRVAA